MTMRCVFCGRGPDRHEGVGHSPLYMRDRDDAPAVGRRHVAPRSLPRQDPVVALADERDPLCLYLARWLPGFWHKVVAVDGATVTTKCGKRRREPDQRVAESVALGRDELCLRCSA